MLSFATLPQADVLVKSVDLVHQRVEVSPSGASLVLFGTRVGTEQLERFRLESGKHSTLAVLRM